MENKINIAKLLKDCPQGMELDCTMYEDVYFDYVDKLNIIHCYIQHETHKTSITFNQHGTPNSDIKSKCVIFPKGKTTWEGFVPTCKFKVGDRIRHKTYIRQENIVTEIKDNHYILDNELALTFISQDEYELVPNKFDVTTLKPFDKVLVRCGNNGSWTPQFFAKYRLNSKFPFECTYNSWSQCIPYEGNEHLLGTTNDCDEYYKVWE